MAEIHNLKELKELNGLREDDTIYFDVGERTLEYIVSDNHCFCYNGNNAAVIFEYINIYTHDDMEDFASLCYGYDDNVNYGAWPCCRPGDYKALSRMVGKIYELLKGDPTPTSDPEDFIKNRFDILDFGDDHS